MNTKPSPAHAAAARPTRSPNTIDRSAARARTENITVSPRATSCRRHHGRWLVTPYTTLSVVMIDTIPREAPQSAAAAPTDKRPLPAPC